MNSNNYKFNNRNLQYYLNHKQMEKDSVKDFFLHFLKDPSSLQNGSELIKTQIKNK